jgi:hypothetical protein
MIDEQISQKENTNKFFTVSQWSGDHSFIKPRRFSELAQKET